MNQLGLLGLGDRVTGRVHACEGIPYRCNEERCRKFAGFVIDIVNEGLIIRGNIGPQKEKIEGPIAKRWIFQVNPGEVSADVFATNVLAHFVKPRERSE